MLNNYAKCVVSGKLSLFHVKNALEISEDENIKMISESIHSIKSKNEPFLMQSIF